KKSTERRLEETAADLARLDDLIREVQTQVRSLARQRGKAERYAKLVEQRFGVAMTLVRRELEDLDLTLGALGGRAEQLAAAVPAARARLAEAEREREGWVQARHAAEAARAEVERRLADARLDVGRLEGDLALAAERLRNAGERRATAGRRREELAGRTAREQEVRDRLLAQRAAVRALEEELQRQAEAHRALAGERAALERECAELRQQVTQAGHERAARETAERAAAAEAG